MTERHFRVVQLDGKKVEIGGVSISSKASPGSAARKLLTSIAHHKGLKKNKKASMPKVKFCIQEYTQGSSKKVYGPYVGHYHKYTAAELKKAKTADGKVKFTMKPVVKLVKGKNMKGGENNSNKLKELMNNKNTLKTYKTSFNSKYKYYIVRNINGDNVDIQKFTTPKLIPVLTNLIFSLNTIKTISKNNIIINKNNATYGYGIKVPLKVGNILKKLKTNSNKYTRDNRLSLLYELKQ